MLTTIEKQEIKNVDGLNFFSDRQMRQFDEMEKQLNESKKQLNESERRAREAEKQLRELKKSGMDEDAMNRLIYSWTEEEK